MFDLERSYKDFLLGLAIGGSLGALMFTTKKGKLVQKDILRKYHMMSNKAHHFIKDGIEKLASPSKPKRRTHSTTKRKTKTKKKKR
jgi:gas vesicle protein